MPRNKRPQDPEEKRAEIVTAARRLFLRDGYERTSMGRLAKEAGIASNTIYWYFDDKDDLLVAVLDAEIAEGFEAYQDVSHKRATDRLLWLLARLRQVRQLVSTVHERAAHSERVNAWHERFHEVGEAMLRAEFAKVRVPASRREATAKIWVFTLEGLLAHPLDAASERAVCQTLASALGLPGA